MKQLFQDRKIRLWLVAEIMVMAIYAWFSYGLMTPNLVLLDNAIYWNWQMWMSAIFYNDRVLTGWIYLGLIAAMWVIYIFLARAVDAAMKEKRVAGRNLWWLMILAGVPLLFSYNALSADVFNYIFNAKMVTVYHANPHVMVAQDFPQDPMLKFMHNSHTPAPYGYGWTLLSVPFFVVGLGKFILQWLAMRGAAVLILGLTGWLMWTWWREHGMGVGVGSKVGARFGTGADEKAKGNPGKNLAKLSEKKAAFLDTKTNAGRKIWWQNLAATPIWVWLNPLVLLEIVSNDHNDLWMVLPAMTSLWLLDNRARKNWWRILGSAALLIFSTQVKFATLVIVPFWLYLVGGRELLDWLRNKFRSWQWLAAVQNWGEKYFFDLIAAGMFVPLLTARSQWFHPWYLTWSLMWLPFCKWTWTRIALLAFSLSAMLRYLPFLWDGNYGETVLVQQRWITFGVAGVVILGWMIYWWVAVRKVERVRQVK